MDTMLTETLKNIPALDAGAEAAAAARLDNLTKPPGSLGRLEEFARRLAAITGQERPRIDEKTVFVFAADHGVTAEGVSAYPREVTSQMVLNFLAGGAAINALADNAGSRVVVVDVGVDCEFEDAPGLVTRKCAGGTGNIRKGPAMTRDQAVECLESGIRLAREHSHPGAVFAAGEMGIGNTTASSAVLAALTGASAEEATGRGTGVSDAVLAHKTAVVQDALENNRPDPEDPVDVIAKVGGFEIAAMAGLALGAASLRVPLVVDGFISTVAALAAVRLAPRAGGYMFASHRSAENGGGLALKALGIEPMLDLGLRLGEGTGAVLAISLLEASLAAYSGMATFGEAQVSEGASNEPAP